jgi:hypothetical protein
MRFGVLVAVGQGQLKGRRTVSVFLFEPFVATFTLHQIGARDKKAEPTFMLYALHTFRGFESFVQFKGLYVFS